MAKKTCPECDGELLEDGSCPTCGSSPNEDTGKEETEKEDTDLEEESTG